MSTDSLKKPKRLVLLDAHAILHRAYHALPDFTTSKGEPTGALYGLSAMLLKIIEDLKPDYLIACYDLKGPTHRHEVFKAYKAQRKTADDALIIQMTSSRKIFEVFNIPIYDKQGFEADDILGTIVEKVTKGQRVEGDRVIGTNHKKTTTLQPYNSTTFEIIIASGDMDTLQLVKGEEVKVYTLKKGINDTIMYDEKAVNDRYGFGPELIPDYKGLRGDPSDNIPGIRGIGEKTATILVTTFGTIENIYKELDGEEKKFEKAGISPRIIQLLKDNREEAEFSKMLATIRKDAPIDFELPAKTFRENMDVGKVKAFWNELEFRTLGARLEKVLKGKDSPEKPRIPGVMSVTGESEDGNIQLSLTSNIPPDEIEKVGLAVWLVNSNLTNPTPEDILNFGNTDDFETAKQNIFAELDKRNLRKIYEDIELPLISITHNMEKRGVKIDRVLLANLGKKYHAELNRLEKAIWKHAGVEFNINSPKQLGDILFDKLKLVGKNMKKTNGGARSTRESELEKLRDLHPIVPMLFEYRELQKLLSTYIDVIPALLDKKDRLHSDFIPAGTTTGRMASLNPNLQNIPVKSDLGKAIRGAFVAEKGFKLVAFDYSQMELRIAAFLSGDEKLIEIFKKGEDVHSSVAASVFGVKLPEVTPGMRRQAKVINFGILYGMGVSALKQNLGTTREEAQKFYNDYFATFSTLAAYIDTVKSETAVKGYTETFFGRRRYFEGIKSKVPFIRASAERMAFNAPIQGTEADVIKLAMIRIDEYIQNENLGDRVFALLQVHDELVYEIKADLAEKIAPKIEKIMETIIDPKETKGVVMKANSSIGDNWGELK